MRLIAVFGFCLFGLFHLDDRPKTEISRSVVLADDISISSGFALVEAIPNQQYLIDRNQDLEALLKKESRQRIELQRILLAALFIILLGVIAY